MKKIVFILFLVIMVFAETQTNQSQLYNSSDVNATIVSDLPKETNDTNVSNWNMADWKKHFSSINTNVIGNTQALFGGSVGGTAFSANPNLLTSSYVSHAADLNNTASMTAWNNNIQETVRLNSINNPVISASSSPKQIKCYITREITFQYKCPVTGVVYGGDIEQNGEEARKECEANCYEQRSCVAVQQLEKSIEKDNIICEADNNCSYTYSLDNGRNLKKIVIELNQTVPNENYISMGFENNTSGSRTLLDDYKITSSDKNITLYVNNIANSVYLNIKNTSNETFKISKILFEYESDGKYICPALQDISQINPDKFAYVCPSGNITTFDLNGVVYKICVDGKLRGDNADGTFSTLDKCMSACRESYDCELDTKMFTTDLLKTFREGCIQGQGDCTDTDCKYARINKDPILEEVVYDATNHPTITVKDGVLVKNVYRPRISISDDTDYLKRAEEEWKDNAFKDMVENRKYAVTKYPLGENTEAQSAYAFELVSGADYGYPQTSVRTLDWLLKPRAFDVYSNKNYYLYAILVVDVGYYDYNELGEKEKKRKIIWYLKTSTGDDFKPVRIKWDAGDVVYDNNTTSFQDNITSPYKTETFIGDMWVDISDTNYAEYFENTYFNDAQLFWKFPIIDNVGNLIYELPGLVRSVTTSNDGLTITKHYDGYFNGTGDGVLNYKVYTIYSPNLLTYKDIFDLIDSGNLKAIYSLNDSENYPNQLGADSVSVKDIKIYQYGTIDKTSIKVRIRPDKEDIGKKGFIYVFIQ